MIGDGLNRHSAGGKVRIAVVFVALVAFAFVGLTGTAAAQATTAPDCGDVSYAQDVDGNYEVTNVSQLQCMGTTSDTSLTDSFVLTQDINASGTSEWEGGAGFKQIDDFEGTLDGQGYEITDLTINRPGETRVGLFGESFGTVDVKNLGLVDVNITASFTSGTILGLGDARISDSYVTGSITGENVGGLIGRFNGGRITRSYTDVEVVSNSGNAGGLVETMNSGTIEESYALGDAQGGGGFASVGGIVGFGGGGTVRNSYARGNATATGSDADAGGLVGTAGNFGVSVENAYSTGVVSGATNEGGFAGAFNGGSLSNGYWDTETSGLSDGIGTGSGDVTGLTTSEMTGTSAQANMSEFDFADTWATVSSPDDYPVLRWQDETGVPYFVVDVTGTNSPVTENEILTASVDVENVGGSTGTQTVELFYDDTGDGNAETSAESAEVNSLSPGETRTVELEWTTDSTVVPTTEPQEDVAIRATSEDNEDTDTVTVQREFNERVAVVSSLNGVRDALRNSISDGLEDAGERADFGLIGESPSAVTGSDASDAVDTYDALVVNDFGGVAAPGGEGSFVTPEMSDEDVQNLYDNITAGGGTRLVSLDNGEVDVSSPFVSEPDFENVSNAITKRSTVLGDPVETNNLGPTDAPARMNITDDHPLFKEVGNVSEIVAVYNNGSSTPPAPLSWFGGFGDEVVGDVGNGTEILGSGAGVTTNDNEVLLSLGGIGVVSPTDEADRILANALLFPFDTPGIPEPDIDVGRAQPEDVPNNETDFTQEIVTDEIVINATAGTNIDVTVNASSLAGVDGTDLSGAAVNDISLRGGSLVDGVTPAFGTAANNISLGVDPSVGADGTSFTITSLELGGIDTDGAEPTDGLTYNITASFNPVETTETAEFSLTNGSGGGDGQTDGTTDGRDTCIDRRDLSRGEGDQECPFDRDLQRGGETREDLDESTGRGGRGEHRDSATARRDGSRGSRSRGR